MRIFKTLGWASALLVVHRVASFNVCVIGNGPSGTLAAIAMARRGHDVTVFEQRPDNPVQDSRDYNLVLTQRGMNALERFEVPFLHKSVHIHQILAHTSRGKTDSRKALPSVSINRNDLIKCMKDCAENLGVSIHESTLHTIDFKENTVYLGNGSHKYDMLVGADGVHSRVRSSLRICDPLFDLTEKFDRRQFKTFGLSNAEMRRMDGYDDTWKSSFHVWQDDSMEADLVCPPTLEGGVTASYISAADLDLNRFPGVFNSMEWYRSHDLKFQRPRSQKSVYCSHVGIGNVVLIGDAGHAMCASLGQGVNAALEDCVVMDMCSKTRLDPSQMASMYNKVRIDDAHAVCELSEIGFGSSDRSNRGRSHGAMIYIGNHDISYDEILRIVKETRV